MNRQTSKEPSEASQNASHAAFFHPSTEPKGSQVSTQSDQNYRQRDKTTVTSVSQVPTVKARGHDERDSETLRELAYYKRQAELARKSIQEDPQLSKMQTLQQQLNLYKAENQRLKRQLVELKAELQTYKRKGQGNEAVGIQLGSSVLPDITCMTLPDQRTTNPKPIPTSLSLVRKQDCPQPRLVGFENVAPSELGYSARGENQIQPDPPKNIRIKMPNLSRPPMIPEVTQASNPRNKEEYVEKGGSQNNGPSGEQANIEQLKKYQEDSGNPFDLPSRQNYYNNSEKH